MKNQTLTNKISSVTAAAGLGAIFGFVTGAIRSLAIPTSIRSVITHGVLEEKILPEEFGNYQASALACRASAYAMVALTHTIVGYEMLRIIAGQGASTLSSEIITPWLILTNALSAGYEIYRPVKNLTIMPAAI